MNNGEWTRRGFIATSGLAAAAVSFAAVDALGIKPPLLYGRHVVSHRCGCGVGTMIRFVYPVGRRPRWPCFKCGVADTIERFKLSYVMEPEEVKIYFWNTTREPHYAVLEHAVKQRWYDALGSVSSYREAFEALEPRPHRPWPGDDFKAATMIEHEWRRGRAMKKAFDAIVEWSPS